MTERIVVWLLDRGAHWFEVVGDALASPWYRLSGWCSRRWFDHQPGEASGETLVCGTAGQGGD